jgi:hypothetical protein
MSDEHDLIDRSIRRWDPPEPAMERLLRRRDRKRKNQRLGTAVMALVIAAVAVAGTLAALERSFEPRPAEGPITPDNVSELHLAWSADVEGRPTGLATTADAIFVAATGSEQLQRFALSCGDRLATCRPDWFAHPSEADAAGVWVSPDGRVFLTTDRLSAFADSCPGGSTACLPIATGALEGVPQVPVGAGGSVIVATGDNRLYAFRQTDCGPGSACTPEWLSRRTTTPFVDPVVVGDNVVVSQVHGSGYESFPVRCATHGDVCDPSVTWTLPEGWLQYSPPAVAGDTMYMTVWTNTHAGIDAALLAIPSSCATGGSCRVLWKAPVDPTSSVGVGTPVVAGDHVIVALLEGSVVQAFPASCGGPRCQPLWTGPVDAVLGNSLTPVVLNGVVFAPGQGGGATAFPVDCATECRPLWTDRGEGAPVPANAGAVAVAGDSIVVAGGEEGAGRLEVFRLGGSPSPPARDGGTAALPIAAVAVVAGVAGVALLRRRLRVERP